MQRAAVLASLFFCAVVPATAADRPNVLFLAIDDWRNDLGALGVAHAKTPQLDAFAKTARVFSHHYVQVPTCGASRCALLRGRYPSVPAQLGNNGIRDTQANWAAQSLPAVFRQNGYRTLALGKITHYPGRRPPCRRRRARGRSGTGPRGQYGGRRARAGLAWTCAERVAGSGRPGKSVADPCRSPRANLQ
jgi:arylsulfatase A-like enzyme